MSNKITIGTRGSKLALLYAQKAKMTILQNTNLRDEEIVIKISSSFNSVFSIILSFAIWA